MCTISTQWSLLWDGLQVQNAPFANLSLSILVIRQQNLGA